MLGAIIGDICGSYYEHSPVEKYDFKLLRNISNFTDDSVLTVATAYVILNKESYSKIYKSFSKSHIHRGYGHNFIKWMESDNSQPYNSYGNGSAMRVSPIGYIYNTLEETLNEAKRSAEVTHNHIEGIKGAQAIAMAIYLARNGESKNTIKKKISENFKYNLNRTLKDIRHTYKFDVSCQGSVPESIISFLESSNYESAIRNAIYLGGDADTLACMSGSIAEAYYKEIPASFFSFAIRTLPIEFIKTIDKFYKKYEIKTKFQ